MNENEYQSRAVGLLLSLEQIGFTLSADFADEDARNMVRDILLHALKEAYQDGVRAADAKGSQGWILTGM